jgi:Leucine-rich repeat (LRR) protein
MLCVSENVLIELPAELGQLSSVEELDFRKNKLHRIPVEIGALSNLQKLFLRNNQLSVLPPELADCTRLETLLLKNNHILALPDQISKLVNLKVRILCSVLTVSLFNVVLYLCSEVRISLHEGACVSFRCSVVSQVLELHQNELRVLNANIDKLKALQDLDLNFNHLAALPKLKHLKSLTKLSLAHNQLTSFPAEILTLKELKVLDLEGNKLGVLPAEISGLSLLEDLCLTKNSLTMLPVELSTLTLLKRLNVSQNDLPDLPPEFKNLKKLEELDIRNNPMCTDGLRSASEWKRLLPHLNALKSFRTGASNPAVRLFLLFPPVVGLLSFLHALTSFVGAAEGSRGQRSAGCNRGCPSRRPTALKQVLFIIISFFFLRLT